MVLIAVTAVQHNQIQGEEEGGGEQTAIIGFKKYYTTICHKIWNQESR